MKLYDLKNVLDGEFDFCDDEVSVRFFMDLNTIPDKYLKQIEVIGIDNDSIGCRFTEFLRHHKTAIKAYLKRAYYDTDYTRFMINQLCEEHDILSDGGECVYHFIYNDLEDLLTGREF